jgi:hypothetical protein
MSELGKRKKEFLKAYNNLCSCYGDIVSEQTKTSCNLLVEKTRYKADCCALAKLVLKLSPERKEWLEKHYGEYL